MSRAHRSACLRNERTVDLFRRAVHADGLKGFATQGVLPEMMRATYMRVLKFFLFPITHKSMFGTPENKGSPATKAIAAAVASLPEGFTIQPLEVAKITLQLVWDPAFSPAPYSCASTRGLAMHGGFW